MAAANIQPMIDRIRKNDDVADSALIYIKENPQRMRDAVAAALALGTTAEELKPLTDELDLQDSKMQEIKDAIVANTASA